MSNHIADTLLQHEHIVKEDHITQLFNFISKHQWIYDFQFTKFFVEEVWKKAPAGWLDYLITLSTEQLKHLTEGTITSNCPDSLKEYIETCIELSTHRKQLDNFDPPPLNSFFTDGLSMKKKHEITAMSSLVHNLASCANIHTLVDVGSGLGYIDHALSSTHGYDILGIECHEIFAHKSEMRAAQFEIEQLPTCKFSTCILQLKQSKECLQQFEEALSNHQQQHKRPPTTAPSSAEEPVMLMGLHCCGDLTPTVMNIFLQLNQARILSCISCCYHKMDYNINEHQFTNFPMSAKAKKSFSIQQGINGSSHLNVYALRLAAQQTKSQWMNQTEAQYDYCKKNVTLRGLLEILFLKEGIAQSKQVCRVKKKINYSTAEAYIDAVLSNIQDIAEDRAHYLSKEFLQLFADNQTNFQFIEPITCLQVLLQPVLETLIHYDRLAFLQENGCRAYLIPLFNEQISPRNIIIVAEKK
ncbi:protein RRNAD1-like [Octopus sinensis]|uniref:Protein RRNAD1-like n=1 Tax=Octopus sinensis TaxID=2607531 RepID=A0A6P7T6C3_9MOLL|nr:protein RRNAD1-like [Octopus sinensis]XP_036365499.1 protein RRNAD1-like [Octopus sinensis]